MFAENVNSVWFTKVPFILFLHKSDLFDDKIMSVPIKAASCFSGYGGPDDREASLSYIKGVFNCKIEKVIKDVLVVQGLYSLFVAICDSLGQISDGK